MDVGITSIFTLELIINLFAHSEDCFLEFYSNNNYLFDACVVLLSIASIVLDVYKVQNMVSVKMVRLIRCCQEGAGEGLGEQEWGIGCYARLGRAGVRDRVLCKAWESRSER